MIILKMYNKITRDMEVLQRESVGNLEGGS